MNLECLVFSTSRLKTLQRIAFENSSD
ncbi:hypothetical protein BCEN4_1330034 [Burkholderia cenocepacia]|nr:hypothetical protein BCEN4_1330034 [Burkholderia cenocepacia]